MKKKYLICIPWELHHLGGVNQVVINLYNELNASTEFEPAVHINSDIQANKHLSKINCTNSIFPFIHPSDSKLKNLLKKMILIPCQLLLWNIKLLVQNIKCINVHYVHEPCYFLCLLKKYSFSKFTLIFSFHGTDLEIVKTKEKYWQDKLSQVDVIITCSDYLRRNLLSTFPSLSSKVVTIHNGINTYYELVGMSSLIPPEEEFLISVGTFNQNKGQHILIEAFAQLIEKKAVSAHLKLVLIGRSTSYVDELRDTVSKYSLEKRVLFFCDVANDIVMATIQQAQLFLLASNVEAFGIVALEAGIVTTPLIAYRTGGLPEFIDHEVTGILLPGNTVSSWSEVIEMSLNNLDYHKQLAVNFKLKISEEFSWQACVTKYCQQIK